MSRRSEQVLLFNAFAVHGVEYVVVGGLAVNAHGHHRYTRDLDLFIRPTIENALAAYNALAFLGAPVTGIEPPDLLDDEEHFQLTTESGSIDILSSIGEMPFDRVWRNRINITLEGIGIPFISREDLIANKLQVGRYIDLADAEELQRLASDDAGTTLAFPSEDPNETPQ